jgi:hypothetical protein
MSKDTESAPVSCGCWLIIVALNFFIGGWSINFLLQTFAEKTIPFFWAGVCGLIAGEISIPVAVVVAILKSFGVL